MNARIDDEQVQPRITIIKYPANQSTNAITERRRKYTKQRENKHIFIIYYLI